MFINYHSVMSGATRSPVISLRVLFLLLWSIICFGTQSDIQCLQTLQQSVKDPNGILNSSWDFNNSTDGYICNFSGVECWHPDKNKVLYLHLSNMGLEGPFPSGLENCTTIVGLDLSNNNFSGPLPADISKQVPYVTNLDLSFNNFHGEIPVSLSNCAYLMILNLQDNQFTGPIPWQLSELSRLSSINVANNLLSGPIPSSLSNYPSANFANNPGLCGTPLPACREMQNNDAIIAAAVGFVVGFVIAFYFPDRLLFCGKLPTYFFRVF